MMASEVYVIGAGGHSKVVISTLQAAGCDVAGAFDDDSAKWGQTIAGVPVLGALSKLTDLRGARGIIAIGNNRIRKSIAERFLDFEWASVVHPAAYVHSSVRIGVGTLVFAGAVVQPDCQIGNHAIVNTSASADHDCKLEDYTQISPGVHLGGGVALDEGVFMGVGSVALPVVKIGAWTVVGAGAVVIKDLPANVTAVGVPARVIEERPS